MSWFDPSRFVKQSPCLPCCETPVAECECAMIIPPTSGTIYSTYSDAEDAIADLVSDCILYANDGSPFVGPLQTFTIAVTATDIDIALSDSTGLVQRGVGYVGVSMLSGETITIDLSVTTDGTNPDRPAFVAATLVSCDYTTIDSGSTSGSETAASDTFVFTAPSDGIYFFTVAGGGSGDSTTFSLTANITFSDVFTVNPVIALWDDSGTTRKLWACPKMLLPPLTEATGDWYADCAAADGVLTSAQVSNCVGYSEYSLAAFTATDGGSSLGYSYTSSSGAQPTFFWGSVNAEAGETLTLSVSISSGDFSWDIYDDAGALIETLLSSGTSSALPYTGRYTLKFSGPDTSNGTLTITSSGIMSVNEIQARYDGGLTCPNTLDCGDACP